MNNDVILASVGAVINDRLQGLRGELAAIRSALDEACAAWGEALEGRGADDKRLRDELMGVEAGFTDRVEGIDDRAEILDKRITDSDQRAVQGADSLMELGEVVGSLITDVESVELMARSGNEAATQGLLELEQRVRDRLDDVHAMFRDASAVNVAAELKTTVERLLPGLTGPPGPPGRITPVSEYREGDTFDAGALARHNGGCWQAACETAEPPGTGDGWFLIADGVRDIEIQQTSDVRQMVVVHRMASGVTYSGKAAMPWPRFGGGTWQKGAGYAPTDVVNWKRSLWVAEVADSDDEPGTSEQWSLLMMAGPSGRRGSPGKTPDIDSIVTAVLERLGETSG